MKAASIAALDAFCQQRHGILTSWEDGGLNAKEVIASIIKKKNRGVSLQKWTTASKQKIAKWLKRERGISLYLQRKRTQVENHNEDYIPYYIDPVHAAALGLLDTPEAATEYTHSIRAINTDLKPKGDQQQHQHQQQKHEHQQKQPKHQHQHQQPVEEELIPLPYPPENTLSPPPLPMPSTPYDYNPQLAGLTTGGYHAMAFNSYFFHPIDPFYLAVPPLENTNHALNMVS